jgi:hypothetical protein
MIDYCQQEYYRLNIKVVNHHIAYFLNVSEEHLRSYILKLRSLGFLDKGPIINSLGREHLRSLPKLANPPPITLDIILGISDENMLQRILTSVADEHIPLVKAHLHRLEQAKKSQEAPSDPYLVEPPKTMTFRAQTEGSPLTLFELANMAAKGSLKTTQPQQKEDKMSIKFLLN